MKQNVIKIEYSEILKKFNEMQKVMLGNAKNLKNSESILCYQEPLIFLMK